MSRRPDLTVLGTVLLWMVLAIAGLTSFPARADSGLLNDSLGRWLDTEVLPTLGRTLGEHPRFKGETIKLVSLDNGQPTHRASRLHKAVEAHLTQRLLRSSGVRIAWSDQPRQTCGVEQQAVYLLGVEIERDGSRYHKLNIGMIDVAESVWVSGVNHSWRGRLTATERAALSQQLDAAPEGTVDNPMPVHASTDIARSMHAHLKCAHPEGLDGPVFLAPAESVDLNRIMASLGSELATAPLAAITREGEQADWVLTLSSESAGSGGRIQALGLMLSDKDNRVTQQVATVYVSGTNPSNREIRDPAHIAGTTALLSGMRLEPDAREGICTRGSRPGMGCAEISFDLLQPAYLFVLSSRDRELQATSCDSRLVEATTGERRFRVKVWRNGTDLPDAGLYAIAVSDRSAAKALARHIRTGACSRPSSGSNHWLSKLDELMARHSNVVEWRVIHMAHTPDGISRL